MKRQLTLFAIAILAALSATVFWAVAQSAPGPLASLFPAGAALYLEAKDFSALLGEWNGSREQRDWLASANYEGFSRSTLFLKLTDAQTQFAAAAGVPTDYALVSSLAGTNSAIAFYDIGKLEFLYVTHLPSARAINTSLWKARGTYQTRHAGSADYFIKEDKASHRVAAFAYVGDSLVLATKESLIAGALQLMDRQSLPSVAAEPWFTNSVQAAGAGQGELRLVYNMASLSRSYQFRSYWVQANVPDLRQFSSGLADLERVRGEIRERRVLLRATPAESAENTEGPAGQLLAAVPDDAGLYRVWLRPSADLPIQRIEEELFQPPAPSAGLPSKSAPAVLETPDAGTEIDLESRIDETPLTDNRDALAALRAKLSSAKIDAMLDVSLTKVDADGIYIQPHSAIVLLGSADWDADAIRNALGGAAEGVWSNSAPASWRGSGNGVRELEGLGHLAIASAGKWLVIGDSSEIVDSVFTRRNRTAVAGAAYAAGWRHARELPNFERMTKMIDFPVASPAQHGAEPLFFSANIASLGRALMRVDAATIVMHDAGMMLRESIVYKLNP